VSFWDAWSGRVGMSARRPAVMVNRLFTAHCPGRRDCTRERGSPREYPWVLTVCIADRVPAGVPAASESIVGNVYTPYEPCAKLLKMCVKSDGHPR